LRRALTVIQSSPSNLSRKFEIEEFLKNSVYVEEIILEILDYSIRMICVYIRRSTLLVHTYCETLVFVIKSTVLALAVPFLKSMIAYISTPTPTSTQFIITLIFPAYSQSLNCWVSPRTTDSNVCQKKKVRVGQRNPLNR
jgi:hypothetical protein